MMHEAVYCRERHGLIREDPSPFGEGLVGRDHQRTPFVPSADQFEKHARFRLILGDIGDVVEDQQLVLVELGDRGFEGEIASGDLEFLHEIGGSREEDAPAVPDAELEGCKHADPTVR